MKYYENTILGLDIGMASVGWALIELNQDGTTSIITKQGNDGAVFEAIGVRAFNVPENHKTKELNNHKRRTARAQRRVIRRRANRLRIVRTMLANLGIDEAKDVQTLHQPTGKQADPWLLRAKALERLLTKEEFAIILLHMAKHRGFQSNSKKDTGGNDKETGIMLAAANFLSTRLRESGLPTIGSLLAHEKKKRNRSGTDGKAVYTYTVLRKFVRAEASQIFDAQRSFGNSYATEFFFEQYVAVAFEQRPLKSTSSMVGYCTFIENERRAPRFAPTAERFRLAAKLVTLSLENTATPNKQQRILSRDEILAVLALLGTQKQKSITFALIRKTLKLPNCWQFVGLGYGSKNSKGKIGNPETADAVTRVGACGEGTALFYSVLGEALFTKLMQKCTLAGQTCLDAIAKVLSDNDDVSFITQELSTLPLSAEEHELLLKAVHEGVFSSFKGTMHLSIKAMEEILPHMVEQLSYSNGCEMAGFDHTKALAVDIHGVRNPLVRKILREVRNQVNTIVQEFNLIPGKVHIELARDVGKSVDERNSLSKGIEKRTSQKNKHRAELAELYGIPSDAISAGELMRYELWKEQDGKCAYYLLWGETNGKRCYSGEHTAGAIPIPALRDGIHAVQVDHILPRSRTQDNSFNNLCLCLNAANQAKGNSTPYEWAGDNAQAWHTFSAWVEQAPFKGLKKRNYLLKDLTEKEERFCERNLNDTRYASRLVMQWFHEKYAYWQEKFAFPTHYADGKEIRRIFARPGALTSTLRRLWGLEGIKKDVSGKRLGDRHHALDAFIIACCTESALQKVTRYYQQLESNQKPEPLQVPMPACRETLIKSLQGVFVSRTERGRTKGALHEETLRSIHLETTPEGEAVEMLYERVPIKKLTLDNLALIKDAERCPALIKTLEQWIEAGKPTDEGKLPFIKHTRKETGEEYKDYIRRVRVRKGEFKSGVVLNRGSGKAQASNESMVRTDVYCKSNKFYLVPVYAWQAANGIVPRKAIKAHAHERDWLEVDDTFTFCFSLIPNSYLVTEESKNGVREGYFICTDRSGANITLAMAHDRQEQIRGIGVQRLTLFEKYRVDRLGRLHKVRKEKRP